MKKLISVLLAAMAVFAMVGCDTGSTTSSTEDSLNENSAISSTSESLVTFLDFEEYNPDFQLFRGTTGFGKISQNSDMQYVKSGKYSAKIQPIGFRGGESKFYYPLMSTLHEFDYADLSQLEMISLAIYNTENENKTFKIGFGDNTTIFGEHTFTMKPGWNNLAFFPEPDLLNISSNVYNVKGLAFRFENAGCYYLKDAPVYYMDDVKLKFNREKEPQNLLKFDEGEIIDFEKDFHHYVYGISATNVDVMPEAEIVKASKEGIEASQGEKVLKVTYKPDPNIAGTVGIIQLPEKFVREALKDITGNITSYAIKFDSYAATRTMTSNCIATYGPDGSAPRWYTNGEWVYETLDYTFAYGVWKTHTIPLFRAENGMIEIVVYLWKQGENEDKERIVYFDNFRIEKIS